MTRIKFDIVYKQGSKNIADFLSRIRNTPDIPDENTNQYVNFVVENSVPYSMSLDELKSESEKDEEILELRAAIRTNNWQNCQKYINITEELSEYDGLRAHRIYVPKSLREKIFKIVNRSHLGMTKTKQALRGKVYWFNIEKISKDYVKYIRRFS